MRWLTGWMGGLALLAPTSVAVAAEPDVGRLRYLVASGQAVEAAVSTREALHAQPHNPVLVALHGQALAALGEGPSLVGSIDPSAGALELVLWVVAVAEGLSAPEPYCAHIQAHLSAPPPPEVLDALRLVRGRLDAVCPDDKVQRDRIFDGAEASVTRASAGWGTDVETWASTDPSDLTLRGNPWSDTAHGPGLVRARVALASAADRAASSTDPARLWWAREVTRWQGLPTTPFDHALRALAPAARDVGWETGTRARWHAPPPIGDPDTVYRVREAAGVPDADRRLRALRDVDGLVPDDGPLRAEWWGHVARCHADNGHAAGEVRALERAWLAWPTDLDRANAFAWAAATHHKRMPRALEAIDAALAAPVPYRAHRGGPEADPGFRWTHGHSTGAALDTRGWLRFQMGDVAGARSDLDRALLLYRRPSATVHFHAALIAHAAGDHETAIFHLRAGFVVVDPRYDDPPLVSEARTLADRLYAQRRWHPGGVEGWLDAAQPAEILVGEGPVIDLDGFADALGSAPPGLPVEGGPLPELVVDIDGTATRLAELEGWRVVELWAAWCVSCHVQMGALLDLRAAWEAADVPVTVVVVSVEESPRLDWPVQQVGAPGPRWKVAWGGAKALDRVGAPGLPATLVVDPSGRVVETRAGWEGDLDWLSAVLAEHGVVEPAE